MILSEKEIRAAVVNGVREQLARFGAAPDKIILFGSRARNDYMRDSDWDFLVITDRKLTDDAVRTVKTAVRRLLAVSLIPVDILIKDREAYNEQRDNVGYVTYYAARDGVAV